jgi:two-component system, OmpR family, sensor kinase
MAVVLILAGGILYARLGSSLQEGIDDGLEARSLTLTALVQSRGARLVDTDLATGDADVFAQVLGPDGDPLATSPSLGGPGALVAPSDVARARSRTIYRERDMAGAVGRARLLLRGVSTEQGTHVLVVGASLGDRREALDDLLAQFLLVGPLALAASALAGYLLAAAALRPVEAMRRRAAGVSAERPGQRLPLPVADDEIRRLGETLNAMLARLEEGLARERRFVADASHELRTPLALLQTELELALRQPRSAQELRASLLSVADEVDRLIRLGEDLLVLARAEEGGLPLHRTPVAPAELLASVARRFAARAAEHGRALHVAPSGSDQVAVDRLRVEQALGNLVDNALRHGAGAVSLAAETRDGVIDFCVSDDGAGFPEAFLPRAFERFARADEARGGGSAGLGLAIAREIARSHGGDVRAVSPSTGGAVVTLSLPIREPSVRGLRAGELRV